MTGLLRNGSFYRTKVMTISEEISRDDMVDHWFLMESFYPVLALAASYLAFTRLGPKLMEKRKPFNVKGLVLVHNFMQIVFNSYLVSLLFTTPNGMSALLENNCSLAESTHPLYYTLCKVSWYYFMTKVYDLMDTVFFVLRKKNSNVSFLHVYHHANMLLTSWAYLKYIRADQGVLMGALNCFVHIVMYTYYFLSALGPSIQKYLWWKSYVTKLQLLQFGMVFFYASSFIVSNCVQSKIFIYYALFQAVTFGILFGEFYRRAYIDNNKKQQ